MSYPSCISAAESCSTLPQLWHQRFGGCSSNHCCRMGFSPVRVCCVHSPPPRLAAIGHECYFGPVHHSWQFFDTVAWMANNVRNKSGRGRILHDSHKTFQQTTLPRQNWSYHSTSTAWIASLDMYPLDQPILRMRIGIFEIVRPSALPFNSIPSLLFRQFFWRTILSRGPTSCVTLLQIAQHKWFCCSRVSST